MNSIKKLCVMFSAVLPIQVFAGNLIQVWDTSSLKTPESIVYDQRTNLLFVSNIDGAPNEKDRKGFISLLDLEGNIVQLKWIEGLNAPKGLAVANNILYVSDIDQLVSVNIDNGRIKRYQAPEAKFLNDVAVDDNGHVYVSDMLTNTIYQLKGDEFSPWINDLKLESPNGLHVENNQLIVGSWGNMTEGFSTEIPGHLKSVSIVDKSISSLGNGIPVGNLDGVEADGNGDYYVTDWLNGGLFLISRTGDVEKLLELNQGSADHEVILDKQLLLIPMMKDDKVVAYKINN